MIQNFQNTSNSSETTKSGDLLGVWKRFETFEPHRIHVKLPYSAPPLVV